MYVKAKTKTAVAVLVLDARFRAAQEKWGDFVPYGAESLEFSTTSNGSWAIFGQSCKGNWLEVTYDAEKGIVSLEADSRRHALRDHGNMAGEVFRLMFCRKRTADGQYPLDKKLLDAFVVKEYRSWRTDAPWYECGLTPHLVGLEYRRAKAEGRI